jgi:hypothetical protein
MGQSYETMVPRIMGDKHGALLKMTTGRKKLKWIKVMDSR